MRTFLLPFLSLWFLAVLSPAAGAELLAVRRIWDAAPHNAFTDLIRWQDRWWCVFREGQGHVSPDGALRVIVSRDGTNWASAARITSPDADLRDAKICVTPAGELMLSGAGALHPPARAKHASYAWFSTNGTAWSAPVVIGDPNQWLWRTTWHREVAWSIGYDTAGEKFTRLYRSVDGRRFETVIPRLTEEQYPNEHSLVFLPDDSALCLLRRDGSPGRGLLGRAKPPYTDWSWRELDRKIGGPHFLRLPDGRLVAAVRLYDGGARTSLCWLDADRATLTEFLKLPSGGDTSYAGLVWHEGVLWVSYYSSHEEKTAIYLARVKLPPGSDDGASIRWNDALRQPAAWYASAGARRIADNVLLFQHDTGGWPKGEDMAARLSAEEQRELLDRKPRREDSTIDNGATHRQVEFLARVFTATGTERFRDGCVRGLEFLLAAQYPEGGWPQFPFRTGYHRHITYNDDAMVSVLRLLRRVGRGEEPFAFVGEDTRQRASDAVKRGVECLLKTQIVINGCRTVWCAQHDRNTLLPAKARSYELPSFSGAESAGIVSFLMELEPPSAEVVAAVEGAVAWLESARLTGLRVERRPDASQPKGFDTVVVADPAAPPLWARFYDLEAGRPFFCGRDGVPKASLAEIESERRNGYAWYSTRPASLLAKQYPAWKARWAP